MNLSKLQAFIVVAEELNFSRSARILGMSQPPLTRLIASLEEELAVKLFERTTREVSLTPAGIHLLRESRDVIARMEAIENEVRSIGKMKTGHVHIAFSQTAFSARLPKIIHEFQSQFPKIKIEVSQQKREAVLRGLRTGLYDFGFLEGFNEQDGFQSAIVKDEPLGVLFPISHTLAKRKSLTIKDLKNETIILHPRAEHKEFFDTIQMLFAQNNIAPKTYIKHEGESCPTLVSFHKGVILTIGSSQSFAPKDTHFVPIKDLQLPVRVFWTQQQLTLSQKSFLSFTLESSPHSPHKPECLQDGITLN
jgi:DNA-binding transcriptional LysR family regulator